MKGCFGHYNYMFFLKYCHHLVLINVDCLRISGGLQVMGMVIIDPQSEGGIVKKANVEVRVIFITHTHIKS